MDECRGGLPHAVDGAAVGVEQDDPRTGAGADTLLALADHGVDTCRCVRKTNRVTMPKFPPPPPRRAQYRSGYRLALHTTALPSARTTVASSRLSHVSPNFREAKPTPPPSARPPMPTVGHDPPGMVRP